MKLATCGFATSCFQDNTCFENIGRRDAPCIVLGYHVQELLSLWLHQEDGESF